MHKHIHKFIFLVYSLICPHRSSDINDMSDAASNAEPIFEQEVCLEESCDFENDEDYDASPDLLRMME